MKTKIIQMSTGRGPAECAWALSKIYAIFSKEAESQSIKIEVLAREKGDQPNTLKSVSMKIIGDNLNDFLKQWLGTIKWVGRSPYRTMHKRSNWFIGVFELDLTSDSKINEKDIEYQTMRSSGAGGQHVNKVSSAIRAIHKPTGVWAIGKERRSQLQNKKMAKERLLLKLNTQHLSTVKKEIKDSWNNHNLIERGKPVRTFTFVKGKKDDKNKSYKKTRAKLKKDIRDLLE